MKRHAIVLSISLFGLSLAALAANRVFTKNRVSAKAEVFTKSETAPAGNVGGLASQYLDLKCYAISGLPLERFLVLDHLNPLFQDLGLPREQVVLGLPQELCVPVAKNQSNFPIPDTVRELIQYIDLKCYAIQSRPLNLDLKLEHLNPVIRSMVSPDQLTEQVLVQRPVQLCVPVRKNDQPIPPEIQRIIQYIDLKCYEIQDFAEPLNLPLTLDQLNPELHGIPPEDVILQRPQKLCVPVRKNNQDIPPDVLELIQNFDQKCYAIEGPPPPQPSLRLSHLNPVLVTSPPETVKLQRAQHLCVPVAKRLPEGVRYCANKDFRNTTGTNVNDLHVVLVGQVTLDEVFFLSPFTTSSATFDPVAGETDLSFSGGSVPPGETAHTGFCVKLKGFNVRRVFWTFNGTPVGPAPQADQHANPDPPQGRVHYTACNGQNFAMTVRDFSFAVVSGEPIPLERLIRNDIDAALAERGLQRVPIEVTFPPLRPLDCAKLDIPQFVQANQFVVLVHTITSDTPPGEATDFIEYGPMPASVGGAEPEGAKNIKQRAK